MGDIPSVQRTEGLTPPCYCVCTSVHDNGILFNSIVPRNALLGPTEQLTRLKQIQNSRVYVPALSFLGSLISDHR